MQPFDVRQREFRLARPFLRKRLRISPFRAPKPWFLGLDEGYVSPHDDAEPSVSSPLQALWLSSGHADGQQEPLPQAAAPAESAVARALVQAISLKVVQFAHWVMRYDSKIYKNICGHPQIVNKSIEA